MRFTPTLPSLVILACLACAGAVSAAQIPVRVAFIGNTAGTARAGVEQGIDEANVQGRFLGQNYTLVDATAADLPGDFSAVIVAADAATVRAVAEAAGRVPVVNILAEDDALRAACLANVVHTIPSAAMRADAERQWAQAHDGAAAAARAWHPDFRKYAASQLNSRYRKAHGQPMDDQAWAGWAAAKMLSDTVARVGVARPGALLDYLRDSLAFDGQKGADLSVRPTGQLRQPMLLVSPDDRILGEAPVRGVAQSLDSLGLADCAP